MNPKTINYRYLEALHERVLIFDGAMGTSLQTQQLTAEHFGGSQYDGCNDYLVISYPEAVERVHRSFLESWELTSSRHNTFRANRLTLSDAFAAGPNVRVARAFPGYTRGRGEQGGRDFEVRHA